MCISCLLQLPSCTINRIFYFYNFGKIKKINIQELIWTVFTRPQKKTLDNIISGATSILWIILHFLFILIIEEVLDPEISFSVENALLCLFYGSFFINLIPIIWEHILSLKEKCKKNKIKVRSITKQSTLEIIEKESIPESLKKESNRNILEENIGKEHSLSKISEISKKPSYEIIEVEANQNLKTHQEIQNEMN